MPAAQGPLEEVWSDPQLGETLQREAVAEKQLPSQPGLCPPGTLPAPPAGGTLARLSPGGASTEPEPVPGVGPGRTATRLPTGGASGRSGNPPSLGFLRCRAGVGIRLPEWL